MNKGDLAFVTGTCYLRPGENEWNALKSDPFVKVYSGETVLILRKCKVPLPRQASHGTLHQSLILTKSGQTGWIVDSLLLDTQ